MNVPLLVEAGRVGDGLTRRGDPSISCGNYSKPAGKPPENSAVLLGQLQQDIYQFRFHFPG